MALSYDSRISEESKMRSPDRVLKLELMEGKKPLDVQGRVDPRLFKDGEDSNLLHAVMDTQTSLWSLRYDKGAIPGGLEGRFTSFNKAFDHASKYFENRNLRITKVID